MKIPCTQFLNGWTCRALIKKVDELVSYGDLVETDVFVTTQPARDTVSTTKRLRLPIVSPNT
jgi:hypothetical protein